MGGKAIDCTCGRLHRAGFVRTIFNGGGNGRAGEENDASGDGETHGDVEVEVAVGVGEEEMFTGTFVEILANF